MCQGFGGFFCTKIVQMSVKFRDFKVGGKESTGVGSVLCTGRYQDLSFQNWYWERGNWTLCIPCLHSLPLGFDLYSVSDGSRLSRV